MNLCDVPPLYRMILIITSDTIVKSLMIFGEGGGVGKEICADKSDAV